MVFYCDFECAFYSCLFFFLYLLLHRSITRSQDAPVTIFKYQYRAYIQYTLQQVQSVYPLTPFPRSPSLSKDTLSIMEREREMIKCLYSLQSPSISGNQ